MKYFIGNTIRTAFSGSWNRYFLSVVVVFFLAYSFFIGRSVVAINQRKNVMGDIRVAQGTVSDLEIKYFDLTSSIDMSTAQKFGFVDSQTPTFVYTHPEADTVALAQ